MFGLQGIEVGLGREIVLSNCNSNSSHVEGNTLMYVIVGVAVDMLVKPVFDWTIQLPVNNGFSYQGTVCIDGFEGMGTNSCKDVGKLCADAVELGLGFSSFVMRRRTISSRCAQGGGGCHQHCQGHSVPVLARYAP